jgi:hypothetical protein
MAKATRVHSTPRRTASKIKAKKLAKPASVESEEQRNLRHAKAFRDLELSINNVYCMSEMAAEAAGSMHKDRKEILGCAVYRLCEMTRGLRAKYLADYSDEAVRS